MGEDEAPGQPPGATSELTVSRRAAAGTINHIHKTNNVRVAMKKKIGFLALMVALTFAVPASEATAKAYSCTQAYLNCI